jgi:hypothetical protein
MNRGLRDVATGGTGSPFEVIQLRLRFLLQKVFLGLFVALAK